MTAPTPEGYRTERLGRVSLAVPEAFGSKATFRAGLCAVRDEPWPVPASGTLEARREARERERDALWRQWFAEFVAEAARIDPADYDPDTFDPETLSARQRRRLPVMVEERQLGVPDPEAPVEDPDPGARWLRMAAYRRDSVSARSCRGRALLDAGTTQLWIDTGATNDLLEPMFGWVGGLAATYRPGPPAEAPSGAFVLRHGHLSGTDELRGKTAEFVSATFQPPARSGAPFTTVSLKTHVAQEDPAPPDWTLDEGIAATNAMGRSVGVSFEKVREGVVRSYGGVEGYETVTLGHERGRDPEVVYSWRVEGLHADVLRPSVRVEARSYLSRPGSMTEGETRAVWDRVIDSFCFP